MPRDVNQQLYGTNLFGEPVSGDHNSVLGKRFLVPPFSILDARQGNWVTRKRLWRRGLGLRGEEGRQIEDDEDIGVTYGKNLDGHGHEMRDGYADKEQKAKLEKLKAGMSPTQLKRLGITYRVMDLDYLRRQEGKRKAKKPGGKSFNIVCGEYRDNERELNTGTSIFDPCLCELMYRWFNLPGGSILDPFAGGSTRGLVAEYLGYKYTGIEIRQNQIDANIAQAEPLGLKPNWIHGDSLAIKKLMPKGTKFDMLFTCPPYYDLEVYSIDSRDGSTHDTYKDFLDWYFKLFKRVVSFLQDDRFAVVVVGEIRDKKTGAYRNLVGETIQVFTDLGLHYYNEIILITAGGSLPLRAGRQFERGRKIGKTHQNILVFYKGDLTKVRDTFGTSEYIKLAANTVVMPSEVEDAT